MLIERITTNVLVLVSICGDSWMTIIEWGYHSHPRCSYFNILQYTRYPLHC